jgi:hypothetical protein
LRANVANTSIQQNFSIFCKYSHLPDFFFILAKLKFARMSFTFILRNGHSRQIPKTRKLLARICRGESHFSQKWPLASVGKSGESAQHGSANVGKSSKSAQHGLANVGESGESAQHGSANVSASTHDKIGRFKHK